VSLADGNGEDAGVLLNAFTFSATAPAMSCMDLVTIQYNAIIRSARVVSRRVESEARTVARGKMARRRSKRRHRKLVKVPLRRGKRRAIMNFEAEFIPY